MAESNRNTTGADDIAAELSGARAGSTNPLTGGPRNRRDRKEVTPLPLEVVKPDERQSRLTMDNEALEDMARNIAEHGLVQPITVRPDPNDPDNQTYLIVAGHRRYEAHKLAGLERIEAIIRRDLDDKQAYEIQLDENLRREDLSPLDEAAGYQRFIDEFGYTQDQVASRFDRARTSVSKTLKLNQLPEEIKQEYAKLPLDKRFGKSALIEIASAGDHKAQLSLWRRAKSGADVRAVREERHEKPAKETAPVKPGVQKRRIVETVKYAEEFQRDFRKRLSKITSEMLAANPDQARTLSTVHQQLVSTAGELEAKLAAISAPMDNVATNQSTHEATQAAE
jgi:ParB/RepB/Spo0J family partition protein